jgi:hypothetical protein
VGQVDLDDPNGPVLSAFPLHGDQVANRPESPWSNSRHCLMLERNRRSGTDGEDVNNGIDDADPHLRPARVDMAAAHAAAHRWARAATGLLAALVARVRYDVAEATSRVASC